MSTAKTATVASVVGAAAVAVTLALSSGDPATTGQNWAGSIPMRSQTSIPKNKSAIVKVYIAGKLQRADTLRAADDGMVLYIKEQLIKSR